MDRFSGQTISAPIFPSLETLIFINISVRSYYKTRWKHAFFISGKALNKTKQNKNRKFWSGCATASRLSILKFPSQLEYPNTKGRTRKPERVTRARKYNRKLAHRTAPPVLQIGSTLSQHNFFIFEDTKNLIRTFLKENSISNQFRLWIFFLTKVRSFRENMENPCGDLPGVGLLQNLWYVD